MLLDARPTRCCENQNGDSPHRKILLIAQILIGGYKQFKTFGFGCIQKLPVVKIAPTPLESRLNRVMAESAA